MPESIDVLAQLNAAAAELDQLAADLFETERMLEPITLAYEDWMASYEGGLWTRHIEDGAKWPPEVVRQRMGHRAMPPELLGRYSGLVARRRRLKDRIGVLKESVGARRSVLSAMKEGLVQ